MKTGIWIGDGGCYTGFAVVNHSIIENLPEGEYDIHHIAVNYHGDYQETASHHKLYPAHLGGDMLGMRRVEAFVKKFSPDFIFMLNDMWVIMDYMGFLPTGVPVVTYSPVDAGPVQREWAEALSRVAQAVAYTEYGANEILKANPNIALDVIPHGIDQSKFFHIPQNEARVLLDNSIGQDDWVVLNANRNQPRKRTDLTIKGFCEFAKDKPENVKLYLHMGLEDSFIRIDKMMARYDESKRLYITSPTLSPANGVSVERLNIIYNCCDYGINTSMGEGWGLVPFEHAAGGSPQIVPDNSASAEVFGEGRGLLMPVLEETITLPRILTEGSVVTVQTVADSLQYAYDNPKDMQIKANAMTEYMNLPKFDWKNIALQWHNVFERVTS